MSPTVLFGRVRWLEPIGQALVLTAVGVQFFTLSPASEASSRASANYSNALLREFIAIVSPENYAGGGIARDKAIVAFKTAEINAEAEKREADEAKARSSLRYFGLFAFGSALAIIGKTGSIIYGTKSTGLLPSLFISNDIEEGLEAPSSTQATGEATP